MAKPSDRWVWVKPAIVIGLVAIVLLLMAGNANYVAVVTPGGTMGAANCLVVSNRTTTQFTISNLNCNSGAPANVNANLLVFWIAVEQN
jgi:hypothetical protein